MTKFSTIKIKKYLNFATKFIKAINAFLAVFKPSKEQINNNTSIIDKELDIKTEIINKAADFICTDDIEGFRATVYQCSAGVNTIGYGSTECLKGLSKEELSQINISEKEARKYALEHISKDYDFIQTNLNGVVIPDQLFVALLSFVYNVGKKAFKNSTLLKILKANNYTLENVASQFKRWNKSKNKEGKLEPSDGLKNRREKEIALFLN